MKKILFIGLLSALLLSGCKYVNVSLDEEEIEKGALELQEGINKEVNKQLKILKEDVLTKENMELELEKRGITEEKVLEIINEEIISRKELSDMNAEETAERFKKYMERTDE